MLYRSERRNEMELRALLSEMAANRPPVEREHLFLQPRVSRRHVVASLWRVRCPSRWFREKTDGDVERKLRSHVTSSTRGAVGRVVRGRTLSRSSNTTCCFDIYAPNAREYDWLALYLVCHWCDAHRRRQYPRLGQMTHMHIAKTSCRSATTKDISLDSFILGNIRTHILLSEHFMYVLFLCQFECSLMPIC